MVPARCALAFLLIGGAAVSQQYVISTVAGGAPIPTPITATSASIGDPQDVAIGPSGDVYSLVTATRFTRSIRAAFSHEWQGMAGPDFRVTVAQRQVPNWIRRGASLLMPAAPYISRTRPTVASAR